MESHEDKPPKIDPQGADEAENVQHEAEKPDEKTLPSEEDPATPESSSVETEEISSPQSEPSGTVEGDAVSLEAEESAVAVDNDMAASVSSDALKESSEDSADDMSAPEATANNESGEAIAEEPIADGEPEAEEKPEEVVSVTVETEPTVAVEEKPEPDAEKEDGEDATKALSVAHESTESPAEETKEEGEEAHSRDIEHEQGEYQEDDPHDIHHEEIDYDHLDKDQIEHHLAQISRDDDIRSIDRHLRPIKARFDQLFGAQRQEALDKFLGEGFEEEDFEYREDDQSQKIHAYLELLRDKRQKHYADREKQKEENLSRKEEILEKIRELIDGEESDISIKGVKDLQEQWKSIGPVPGQHNKTLWANYNALLDRFYDARSIYFELKDLDRKKNLKLKLDICERAEALDAVDNVKEAVVQLNELHEEFKHVGPIPRADQESVWQRFKAASDKIYVKRKGFVDELKKSLNENLVKKQALADETEQFVSFNSDRISDWNKKTKEIQQLQRNWEAIGGIPRDKAKQVNKKFWGGFKHFFANKSAFFKKFESQREENLVKKQELVKHAEELKESSDWQGTTEAYKKLQAAWKEIGPVPEKYRNSIYEEFKAACDHFFDRRRDQNKEQNQEYEENYKQKQIICDSISQLAKTEVLDLDLLYDLIDQYNAIGFVPRNVMRKIQERFNQATTQAINSPALDDEDRSELKMNIEVSRLKGSPHGNRKLFRKENSLKRKIDNLQSDINTWKTNMEFFASSKAADELKKDFELKIEKAQEELKTLRMELRMLNH